MPTMLRICVNEDGVHSETWAFERLLNATSLWCQEEGVDNEIEGGEMKGRKNQKRLIIYGWPEMTIRELTELVKEHSVSARKPYAELSYAFIYPGITSNLISNIFDAFASAHINFE